MSTVFGGIMTVMSTAFGFLGVSGDTGNGYLNFVKFFEMSLDFLSKIFAKLFSGISGLAG